MRTFNFTLDGEVDKDGFLERRHRRLVVQADDFDQAVDTALSRFAGEVLSDDQGLDDLVDFKMRVESPRPEKEED